MLRQRRSIIDEIQSRPDLLALKEAAEKLFAMDITSGSTDYISQLQERFRKSYSSDDSAVILTEYEKFINYERLNSAFLHEREAWRQTLLLNETPTNIQLTEKVQELEGAIQEPFMVSSIFKAFDDWLGEPLPRMVQIEIASYWIDLSLFNLFESTILFHAPSIKTKSSILNCQRQLTRDTFWMANDMVFRPDQEESNLDLTYGYDSDAWFDDTASKITQPSHFIHSKERTTETDFNDILDLIIGHSAEDYVDDEKLDEEENSELNHVSVELLQGS